MEMIDDQFASFTSQVVGARGRPSLVAWRRVRSRMISCLAVTGIIAAEDLLEAIAQETPGSLERFLLSLHS